MIQDTAKDLCEDEYFDVKFTELKFEKKKLSNKIFENCLFEHCEFSETQFIGCRFIDCEFLQCNLTAMVPQNTSFSETLFSESKLLGVNWTQAKWPLVHLLSPIKIFKSNISHCNFYELNLKETVIEQCKAHDVDFRGADFSNSRFVQTDLAKCLFLHTNLSCCDFTDAFNYNIDPNQNTVKGAKFSLPDALNLLEHFEIEIIG